ncbi:MAG TPA: FHA domain-containing protein [Verrucomicrobiae bacterium]
MARLVVNPDSAEAWEIELRPGTNSLGRGEENDFQIEHSSVSSAHCRIEVSGSNALLKDLGSTNGTFIDGQLVEEARLCSGQVFCLGDVRLRFEGEPAAETVPPLPPSLREARSRAGARPTSQSQREPRFAARVCGALLYPLAKDGVLLLLAGTFFFSVLEAGKFFARYAVAKGMGLGSLISLAFLFLLTAIGAGYLASYLRRIATGTAMGEIAAPDWPDISDFTAEIFLPLVQLVATILASLVPAIVVGMFVQDGQKASQAVVWVACGFGAIYFPMAFLAVAMFDSVAALNPLLVMPSIAKTAGSYLWAVGLFGAVLGAKLSGDYYLPKIIHVPILPSVISILVGLYLLMVGARVLGLLYLVNKERLAWFGHR